MLKRHEVEWVKRLAEQGLSRRKIAQKTGFARDTVRKILDGRRPDYDALRRERLAEQGGPLEEPLFSGPIERCPTCGGRVYMPCVACKVRASAAQAVPAVDIVALRRRKIAALRKTETEPEITRRRAA